MATVRFQDLIIYQLAEELADEIWRAVKRWDRLSQDTIGKQIVRSADSIGANIAEGAGRFSFQDNRRFIRISRGSLNETQHWLRQAFRRGLLDAKQTELLKSILDNLGPKLNAYLGSIGKKCSTAAQSTRTNDE